MGVLWLFEPLNIVLDWPFILLPPMLAVKIIRPHKINVLFQVLAKIEKWHVRFSQNPTKTRGKTKLLKLCPVKLINDNHINSKSL